jgi:hypothetical protein
LIAGELTLENAALASTLSVNVATKLSMTASSLTGDVEFLSNFNVQMQGSTVTGCLDGNSFVASGSVENCILTGSGSPAYCVYNWKTQRLRLKGNYFAGHVVLLSGANTDISDNEIVGYLTTTGAGYPVDDLRIVHNLIHGGTASTPLLIDVSGDTWVRNLLIENNHVYDNVLSWNATPSDHRAGIYCKFSSTPTGPLIRGVALRGNTVENNLVPAGTTGTGFDGTHGYFGICVGSTDYTTAAYRTDSILIEGNTVKNNGIPDSVDINGTPNGVSLLEPRRMSAQIFVGGGDSSMPGSVKIVNNYVGSYGAQGVGIFIADICHKTGSTESHYYPYRTTIENNTVFMSGALASAYQQLCSILYDGLDNVHDDYPVSIYKGVVTIKSNTVSDPYLYGDTSVNPAGQSAINITPYQNGMAVALASVSNLVFEGNSIYAGSASANKGSLECYLDPILGSLVTDSLVIVGNSCLGTGSYNGGITTLNAASNVIIANNYGTIV